MTTTITSTELTDTGRRTVTVVVNPASGGAIDEADLRAEFERSSASDGAWFLLDWSPTTPDDPGTGQSARAVDAGSDTIVSCGGDGTVRAVLESVSGSTAKLGIVPLGTGNLLAGNLGIADGLDAVATAVSGSPRRLDVATINGERFAVMAGVGFDAMMIRDADSTTKRRFGSVAYFVSALRNVPAQTMHVAIDIDDERVFAGRSVMVLVGNCGSVTGGLEVFPDARPDDGILDVAVLGAERLRDWIGVLWRLVRNTPQRPDLVRRFRGRTIEVRLAASMPYELDGEDRDPTDRLEIGIDPGALEVRC
jgi:YegS/Rv2252/BmrU family lipid kinase